MDARIQGCEICKQKSAYAFLPHAVWAMKPNMKHVENSILQEQSSPSYNSVIHIELHVISQAWKLRMLAKNRECHAVP